MAARAALALSAALLCLVLGWISTPAATAVVAPSRPLRVASLRLDAAGPSAAAAAAALAGASPAPATDRAAPPAVAPTPPPTLHLPPPAPPQADAELRRSVAAVSGADGALELVLAGGGRRLRPGDRFMGWTLASVTHDGAVLRRGTDLRPVSFFGPTPLATGIGGVAANIAPAGAAALPAAHLPPPHPVVAEPRAPTAAEFFRGFKG